MTNTLTICRGLPGSGKSTWAEAEAASTGSYAISRDELRWSLYGAYSGLEDAQEREVTKVQQELVKMHLKIQDVYVHDTNLKDVVCRDWRDLALEAGAEFVIKDFRDVPLDVCLERNNKRSWEGGRSVPEDVIRSMYERQIKGRKLNTPLAAPVAKVAPEAVKQYVPDESLPKAYICDIDGSVANHNPHRSPFDTSKYLLDTPFVEVVNVVRALHQAGFEIVYTSGRDKDFYAATRLWLDRNVGDFGQLVMRHSQDKRNDAIVKLELLFDEVAPLYNVLAAIDDRPRVCRAWRSVGLPVLQLGDPYIEF